jgi:hypothetical protein
MQLKLKSRRLGGHIHVDVYMGDESSMALNGKLIMLEAEYQAFRSTLAQGADIQKLVVFSEDCDLRAQEA